MRYILIEANLVGEIPHTIKAIPGVIGFLGATKGGEPVPMRQSEVNRILGKVDELALSDEEMVIPFVVGESVKVVDGPFNTFSGIIEEIDEQKKKLRVMVKIFEISIFMSPINVHVNMVVSKCSHFLF